MKHGISELEWNDYLDGRAEPATTNRIEAHLIGCLECWESYEQLSAATLEMVEAGDEARHEMTIDDRQMHHLLRGVFTRLRADSDPRGRAAVAGRLNTLETVLAPLCGTETAVRALRTAALNSPARSLDRITTDNWEPFLDKLTAIAAAMCGETFAGLVRESGRF